MVRGWACTPAKARTEQLVLCEAGADAAAEHRGAFACAILSNNTSPVYTIAPVVRVSNKLPYDIRCVLVNDKGEPPADADAVLVAANSVASVPFVAHEAAAADGAAWEKL